MTQVGGNDIGTCCFFKFRVEFFIFLFYFNDQWKDQDLCRASSYSDVRLVPALSLAVVRLTVVRVA